MTILLELGLAALALAATFAIFFSLGSRIGSLDPTFNILIGWGIPAILMYGLVTVARWHDRVLRIARPIGVTLGWSLAVLLSAVGSFAALFPLFSQIPGIVINVILIGIFIWVSIRVTEWAVRAWLRSRTRRQPR